MKATQPGCTAFETVLGTCRIAWTERGIARIQFPGKDPDDVEESVQRAPGFVQDAIHRIQGQLEGSRPSEEDLPIDFAGLASFTRSVLQATRRIPSGRTMTYGELARSMGRPGAARAVGQALARNPVPLLIPCHRVLASGGRLRGFSAPGGLDTKRRLLQIEGIESDLS